MLGLDIKEPKVKTSLSQRTDYKCPSDVNSVSIHPFFVYGTWGIRKWFLCVMGSTKSSEGLVKTGKLFRDETL